MGRGRTTTGMIAASLIATITKNDLAGRIGDDDEDDVELDMGMPAEAEQYLNGQSIQILFHIHSRPR